MAKLIAVGLLLSFGCSSCAYMSAQSRREMAYRHYLAKHMRQRQKQLAKAQKAAHRKLKRDLNSHQPQVSQPTVFSSVEPLDQVAQ